VKDRDICIQEDKFRAILAHLFKDIDFTNKKTNNTFNICIKTLETGDLNINNINNLDKIKVHKYYLLTWYDKDNPMIMYTKGKKLKTIDTMKKELSPTLCDRGRPMGEKNFVTDNCFNIWDTQVEYYILIKYYKKYAKPIDHTYNLITNYLVSDMCIQNKTLVYPVTMYRPVQVPTYIPYPVKSRHIVNDVITQKQIIKEPNNSIEQFGMFTDLIDKINNKLTTVTSIMEPQSK
jgi:hypothetical protein